jgi:leader peptidase (prepilin peptidase)/N-methyltransferase
VLFALLAGSVLGTVTAIAVYVARGRLEEPESVTRDREELQRELERLSGEERAALEQELAKDPLFHKPGAGIGQARLAFGPFLAAATLAYLFVGPGWIDEYLLLTAP